MRFFPYFLTLPRSDGCGGFAFFSCIFRRISGGGGLPFSVLLSREVIIPIIDVMLTFLLGVLSFVICVDLLIAFLYN